MGEFSIKSWLVTDTSMTEIEVGFNDQNAVYIKQDGNEILIEAHDLDALIAALKAALDEFDLPEDASHV